MSDRNKVVRITNVSDQVISIMAQIPNGDFYTATQQLNIFPGKSVTVFNDHLLEHQIANLKARSLLQATTITEE